MNRREFLTRTSVVIFGMSVGVTLQKRDAEQLTAYSMDIRIDQMRGHTSSRHDDMVDALGYWMSNTLDDAIYRSCLSL